MTDEHAMKVAKVIAKAMGDNFADAFKNKERWIAKRGMSGGRFRDVNEPFQHDYLAAAEAAAAIIAADRAELVERVKLLEGALADMLHAVCHETGFAAAVRADSGLAYPWEPLDMAEAKARAALKDTSHDADA